MNGLMMDFAGLAPTSEQLTAFHNLAEQGEEDEERPRYTGFAGTIERFMKAAVVSNLYSMCKNEQIVSLQKCNTLRFVAQDMTFRSTCFSFYWSSADLADFYFRSVGELWSWRRLFLNLFKSMGGTALFFVHVVQSSEREK